jgi:hypothetical protein
MEPKRHADLARNSKKLQIQEEERSTMRQLDDDTLKDFNDFVESGVKQHVDPSIEVGVIFQLLMDCGGESAVPPEEGSPEYATVVRMALKILKIVGDLLAFDFWEHLRFCIQDPDVFDTALRGFSTRTALLGTHERKLLDANVTLSDVRRSLEFADQQVVELYQAFSVALMPEGFSVPKEVRHQCAWTLMVLNDAFADYWPQFRRMLGPGRIQRRPRPTM